MRKLYRFYWDCGRQGDVDGLFTSEESTVNESIGKHVYFGEILGKHSEVHGTLSAEDIEVVSDDQDFIEKLENLLGTNISGYNPLHYLR